MRHPIWISTFAPLLVCSACGPAHDTTRGPVAASAASTSTPSKTAGVVAVDDAIAKACNLPTPRFPFDSANVDNADSQLDTLAHCFTSGPLKDRDLRLTGHADPRGGEDYNLGLGQRRAGQVAGYLEKHGVAQKHISTTSRGAFDATGKDDTGWAEDRRVDMSLAN
jgi:peptidoglycan-associated lipoprotein